MDESQVRTLQEHLDQATAIDRALVDEIRRLARQLHGLPVLPLLGAGASHDCGMRLASEIGEDLYVDYMSDPAYEPRQDVSKDLSDVAEAIYNAKGQIAVVRALGLPSSELWPETALIEEHFCTYRVLARLAREGLFDQAIGFNYDCGKEAGLAREGFMRSPTTREGRQWLDHVTVIADKETFYDLQRSGALKYIKAHGCAERFRTVAADDEGKAADTIIIRKSQLTNWRSDDWMKDRLRDLARTHILLLVGFSAQDATVHGELQVILTEVHADHPATGVPRVVSIDWRPNTPTLQGLIRTGLGGEAPPDGVVTSIDVSSNSTTAAVLIFLAEYLRLSLEPQLAASDFRLSTDTDAQLAALLVTAPLMLRWTYILSPPLADHFMQKINVEQAAKGGYVPLSLDPGATATVLAARQNLRQRLGHVHEESTSEALRDHGFVSRDGFAYLPVALRADDLRTACRPGGRVEPARTILDRPVGLECVLVGAGPEGLIGIAMETGAEVALPSV